MNGEWTEFEWNIFPGFTKLQLCGKVNDLLSSLGQTPEIFTGKIQHMSMFNDISSDSKDKEECSRKKWYPSENSPQGVWDHIADEILTESGHPIFRATTPFQQLKLFFA